MPQSSLAALSRFLTNQRTQPVGPAPPLEQDLPDEPRRFQPSEAELFQLASRDPGSVAPGSNERWRYELGRQLSDRADREARQRAQQDLAEETAAYFRPDVQQQRESEQAFTLKRAVEPARVAGAANVEAARQAWGGREAAADRQIAARFALEDQRQQGSAGRAAQSRSRAALQQRLQALQTGRAHALATGGNALIKFFGGGPSQADLDKAEILQILSQLGIEGLETPGSESVGDPNAAPGMGPTIGTRRRIRGQDAVWDGQGWAVD